MDTIFSLACRKTSSHWLAGLFGVSQAGRRFQEQCHPSHQNTRGIEDLTNASTQGGSLAEGFYKAVG